MRGLVLFGIGGLAALVVAAPAKAASRTWVASNGSGTTCSRSAPCADFQTAHNATDPGGEINCVDALLGDLPANTLTLSRSITIDCTGTIGASSHTPGVNVAGSGIIVRLRNLTFQGNDFGSVGINFIDGAALFVEHCSVYGFRGGAGTGILFSPSSAASLFVSDSSIENNGTFGVSAGIMIKPGSGRATATIVRTKVEFNSFGIIADGSNGAIRGVVRDSVVSGNSNNGITVSGASASLLVENSNIPSNNFGLVAGGSGSGMLVRNSSVYNNGTGLFTTGGGVLLSYGNNSVNGNSAGETFSGPVGQK